jgi:hypothetical protein
MFIYSGGKKIEPKKGSSGASKVIGVSGEATTS